ncbi:MAG TPA: hypothetical protein VFP55_00715 [Solirubrobacteraceae bacterium]|nr:hypothetical protein [Solirubrobacteraceae bacterium]
MPGGGTELSRIMPQPIELTYELHLLPRGRIAFRRWRYELWHGPQLLAAGWRLSALHAQRALRAQAIRYAHRLHGLHPLHPDRPPPAEEAPWSGRPVALESGDLRVMLTPGARG